MAEEMNKSINDEVDVDLNKTDDLNITDDKKITVFYVTDPICVYCWAFEPVMRKFKTLYSDKVNFKVVMGGLLKGWEGFSDSSNGISKPEDVGEHYKDVMEKYGVPAGGRIWKEDPITSSYPASKVVKVVEEISETSAMRILRMIREELLAFNRNVSKDSVLEDILNRQNRNGAKIVRDIKSDHAEDLLNKDLEFSKELGAEAFPTVVISDSEGNGVRIVGTTDFETLENALDKVAGEDVEPSPLPELSSMFDYSRNIFFKEIEVMYDLEPEMVEDFISKNLPENSYEIREVLNHKFIIRK